MINLLWDNLFKREKKESDIELILSHNYLFQNLNKRELRMVQEVIHVRHYRPSETVFRQGEMGVGMYVIYKGNIDIKVEDVHSEEADKMTFVTRLEPGDFFGEIALVESSSRRTATAIAHDDASLIGFFKPDLTEIIERNPSTGAKIMTRLAEVLARRLKETAEKVAELRREMNKLKQ